jgi:hypothetical protein
VQDRLVELAQRRRRLDAQLVGEGPAQPGVRRHRVRLPLAAVEGQHELAVERLPHRVQRDQPLQRADQLGVPPELQLGVEPPLGGDQPKLLEPGHLRLGERQVPYVGEGIAAPEGERLSEVVGRRRPGAGPARPAARPDQAVEPAGVDGVGRHVQAVAAPMGTQQAVAAQRLAQPADVRVHGGDRATPGIVGEQRIDDLLGGDRLPAAQQEERQQGLRAGTADLDHAVAPAHLDRSEQVEVVSRGAGVVHVPHVARHNPVGPYIFRDSPRQRRCQRTARAPHHPVRGPVRPSARWPRPTRVRKTGVYR